ncbi:hypothetical protein BDV19DRAFT_385284 [Aspergillus venezuelensis]
MSICTATTMCSACEHALANINRHDARYGLRIKERYLTFSSSCYPVTFIAEKSNAHNHETEMKIEEDLTKHVTSDHNVYRVTTDFQVKLLIEFPEPVTIDAEKMYKIFKGCWGPVQAWKVKIPQEGACLRYAKLHFFEENMNDGVKPTVSHAALRREQRKLLGEAHERRRAAGRVADARGELDAMWVSNAGVFRSED